MNAVKRVLGGTVVTTFGGKDWAMKRLRLTDSAEWRTEFLEAVSGTGQIDEVKQIQSGLAEAAKASGQDLSSMSKEDVGMLAMTGGMADIDLGKLMTDMRDAALVKFPLRLMGLVASHQQKGADDAFCDMLEGSTMDEICAAVDIAIEMEFAPFMALRTKTQAMGKEKE